MNDEADSHTIEIRNISKYDIMDDKAGRRTICMDPSARVQEDNGLSWVMPC